MSGGAKALMWSMIVGLVGGVVGIVGGAAVTLAIMSPVACVPPCPAQHPPTLSATALQYAVLAFLAIVAAFGAASLALQWIGWSRLRDADRHRYGIGRTGLVLVIVGFVMVLAASAVLYSALLPMVAGYASPEMPSVPPPGALESALGSGAAAGGLLLLGAALVVAGYIAVWVGLWRLDEDHGNGTVRAAIILEIVAAAVAALSSISYAAVLVASALAFISYVLMILGLHGISVRAAP